MEKYRPIPFEILLYFGAAVKAAKNNDTDDNIKIRDRATDLLIAFEKGEGNSNELPRIREELSNYYPVENMQPKSTRSL